MKSLEETAKPIKNTRKAFKLAPKHPAKPEHFLKSAVREVMDNHGNYLVKRFSDAAKHGKDEIKNAAVSLVHYSDYLLSHSNLKRESKHSGSDLANSVNKQTARAIGSPVETNQSPHIEGIVSDVMASTESSMIMSIDNAEFAYDSWIDSGEDVEDYESELVDISGEANSRASVLASMAFGYAFGQMVKEAQVDSGVGKYIWLTMDDSKVRPEHEALHGEECSWDDPPLTAEKSDNGEPDHPGEDYNCRCVASPIVDDDEEQ